MTAREIQHCLFRKLASGCALIVPNYTPSGWFECDVMSVTKVGFFHEHEIKLTNADFLKDTKKKDGWKLKHVDGKLVEVERLTKHERLANNDERGPAHFWFVVPEGMIEESDVLPWAGLKYAIKKGHWVGLRIAVNAPRLHSGKIDPKIVEHARGVCYWRYWRERLVNDKLREKKCDK